MANIQRRTVYLKEYEVPHYLVNTVDLLFDLEEDRTFVTATLDMQRNPKIAKSTPCILQGEAQKLLSISLNGRALSSKEYSLDEEKLTILEVPERFTLEIKSEIHPEKNTELSGLYRAKNLFCTQCEAEGFRRIIYYPDRPDVLSKFTTTIHADKKRYPVLLSNGNLVEKGEKGNRHWVKWVDPFKKPCYLFALVAGDLVGIKDHYLTMSGRLVKLYIYVERENQDKCQHAMEALKKAMRWDEETYGREYDLDIYMILAVNDFNMGAMENKGLNIFNAKYILARPETATDGDYEHIDAVVGHEYFHNWSGNRVTCRDWFQLSLKEGLTVFREHQFSNDISQSSVGLIENVAYLRTHQFAEDAGPTAHPVRPDAYEEINNFYTMTIYEKGAEVIGMLRTLLGKDTFRKGMDLYFERHDGQAVTIEDFVAAMEAVSKRDFTQFRLWYTQAGTPEIEVIEAFDEKNKVYTLTLKQFCPKTPNQSEKLPMHIPVALGLLSAEGRDLLPKGSLVELREKTQSFEFKNIEKRPCLSILREFSAPVKVKLPLDDAQLAFLLAHDSDGFKRWDAGQTLSERMILSMIVDYKAGRTLKVSPLWLSAHEAVLADPKLDPASKAALLSLPASSYLVELQQPADVEAIYLVKKFIRETFAKQAEKEFLKQYHANMTPGLYQYTTELANKRSLKNLCLGYLLETGKEAMIALAAKQYHVANNMTDAFAALSALADIDCPERKQIFAEFYERWQHDPLVVNKWLSAQALSQLPDTLTVVEGLMKHPAFEITNPNKVYALVGAFSSSNLLRFHEKTGRAYKWLADVIIKLDSLNSQVAARMMNAFKRWKRFDEARQALMRKELERIRDSKNLSSDVSEIVNKCLA